MPSTLHEPTLQTVSGPKPGAAVRLRRLSRVFGHFAALRDVTLDVRRGGSLLLLGENGAGKSTLLRMVAGLLSPTHGSVEVLGGPPSEARGRLAYMGHGSMLYDELSATENLVYFAGLHAEAADPRADLTARALTALGDVGLEAAAGRRIGDYSQGMRQRAALARALITRPEVLLLDEPFSNLDTVSTARMVDRLLRFREAGGTLLLTTHQAELARPLAESTAVLRAGRLLELTHATGIEDRPT